MVNTADCWYCWEEQLHWMSVEHLGPLLSALGFNWGCSVKMRRGGRFTTCLASFGLQTNFHFESVIWELNDAPWRESSDMFHPHLAMENGIGFVVATTHRGNFAMTRSAILCMCVVGRVWSVECRCSAFVIRGLSERADSPMQLILTKGFSSALRWSGV
jgi:hypothetical protein